MIKRYKSSQIDELANILKNDGVISVPTDTVYGLCAKMDSKKGRTKLINIKNRPPEKSLPVVCANIEQIKSIAIVGKKAEKIINNFMPGPITIVLLKKDTVPEFVNIGSNEIGIRMAMTKQLQELVKKVGSPLCLTSANKSGEPVCTNLDDIEKVCPDLDGILEGDVLFGMASTIVDCTTEEIKIQREGPISKEEIMQAIENM